MECQRLMRTSIVVIATLAAAMACSRDLTSNSTPSTGGDTSSSKKLNISVDSAFANRTAEVATAIPAAVHVTLAGQPAPGVAVSWVLADGGGSVSPTSSTTDATGVATTTWTLGDTARAYTLTAAISSASVGLQATAVAGPVNALTKISPDTIVVAAGASAFITVRAVDKLRNPVAGVVVSWTTNGGGLTASTTTTGASGNAEVVFSSDATPRTYSVSASATGLNTAAFTIVGR
jgi:hypothetical protein